MSDVKVATQPASQSWPMDRREVSPRAGNRWAVLADAGRLGRLRSTWWVDVMRDWSARATWMEGEEGRLFWYGALMEWKCPVAPVSRMAMGGGEGPEPWV